MSKTHALTYPYWSVTCLHLTYFHDVLLQWYKLFFFSAGSNLPERTAENCQYAYLLISQIAFGDTGISAVRVPFALSWFSVFSWQSRNNIAQEVIRSETKVNTSCSGKVLCTFNMQHVQHYFSIFYNHITQVISSLLEEPFWVSSLI